MRHFILVLFILLNQISFANSADKIQLRSQYYKSLNDKKLADDFMKIMESFTVESDALLIAYKGMSYMLEAKLSYNPYAKFAYFTRGKNLLEDAVEKNPWNIEVRFMRFCIQTKAPQFLGYSNEIELDKSFLLGQWQKLGDIDLKNKIAEFMLKSNFCNNTEKSIFKWTKK